MPPRPRPPPPSFKAAWQVGMEQRTGRRRPRIVGRPWRVFVCVCILTPCALPVSPPSPLVCAGEERALVAGAAAQGRWLRAARARPHIKSLGSEDNLAELDDASPGTPLNSGSRVHAWVKIATGAATGNDAEDAIAVKTEALAGEDGSGGVVVYAQDGLGRKIGSASVDGAIGPDQQVRSAEADLIGPLVAHVVDEPSLKVGALLCYGEENAGRGESLFGMTAAGGDGGSDAALVERRE